MSWIVVSGLEGIRGSDMLLSSAKFKAVFAAKEEASRVQGSIGGVKNSFQNWQGRQYGAYLRAPPKGGH